MKKLIVIFLCFVAISANAQRLEGSVKGLLQAKKAELVMDFSDCSIHGMSEEEYSNVENDWFKDKPEIIDKFKANTAYGLDGILLLSTKSSSDYKIVVKPISINVSGDYVCEAYIYKGNTKEATITDVKGYGGHFGSALNLIKDGAEHTGKKFGAYIKNQLRKAAKEK